MISRLPAHPWELYSRKCAQHPNDLSREHPPTPTPTPPPKPAPAPRRGFAPQDIAEPRVIMPDFGNRSQSSGHRRDYIWQYEYYDDEEPVSFEGLKAHRYSIVIGFWVGLAVFVIFMFFVLTLLTKTTAPHQENPEAADKHHRPDGRLVDISPQQDRTGPSFTRPLLSESQSYSHFYIQEESQDSGKQTSMENRPGEQNTVPRGSCHHHRSGTSSRRDDVDEGPEERPLRGRPAEEEYVFFTQFNIPNYVSLEPGSGLGEGELLYEPSAVLEQQAHRQEAGCDIH